MTRVDPEEYIGDTGIYRNFWERKALDEEMWDLRTKDVVDSFNYTNQEEWLAAHARGFRRRSRMYHSEM